MSKLSWNLKNTQALSIFAAIRKSSETAKKYFVF